MLVACGIAAALQARRRSPRVLIALSAPWILAYALLPQMQERYLIWGAIFTPLCIAASADMLLLHLAVTFVAFVDILRKILWIDPRYAPKLYRTLGDVNPRNMPELGWVVLLVGLTYFYLAWKPDARGRVPRTD
jgi:hypothetical protein